MWRIYAKEHLAKRFTIEGVLPLKKFLALAIGLLIVLAAGVPDALAANWPMFQCDAQRSGSNAGARVRPPLMSTWVKGPQTSTGERRTRPVIADGIVYAGQRWTTYDLILRNINHGQLQAISMENGKPLWTASDLFVAGTPALANGLVYAGTDDGCMLALGAADGVVRWSVYVGGKPNSPAIYAHRLYVTTANGRLCALDGATGASIWSIERSKALSAPAVLDGTVVVGGSELAAFDASEGRFKWSFGGGTGSYSMPTLSTEAVYVSTPYTLHRLDRENGTVVWSRFTGDKYGALASITLEDSTIYLGTVTAIDTENGQTKWTFESENSIVGASVALANGFVFVGSSHHHNQALDHSDGRLYVLKAATGELVWEYLAGLRYGDWYGIDPSPAIAGDSVVLNLSTMQLSCFSEAQSEPLPLPVTASPGVINPYDCESGQAAIAFKLDAPATVTVNVLDSQGKTVRCLVDNTQLDAGEHEVTWYGTIDFPEMVDASLAADFGDKGVLIAPDGDYTLQVLAQTGDGQKYRGGAVVQAAADV